MSQTKRYVVSDPHGAIVGYVRSRRSRANAQLHADNRWGPGCTLSKTWVRSETFQLWFKEMGRCHLCGGNVPLLVSALDPRAATRDHILAKADGGTRRPGNLRLAHRFCNSRRGRNPVGDMPQETYAVLLERAARGFPKPETLAA